MNLFFWKRCSMKGVNFARLYKICSRFGVYLTTEYLSYSTGCPWCCLLSLFKLIITSRKSYGYVQFTIVVARSFFWALLIITCIKQKWANKQQKGCLFFIVCIIIMEFSKHASETLCWKSLTLSLINNEDEIYTFGSLPFRLRCNAVLLYPL